MENMNETITMSRIAFERMQAKDEHNDIWRNITIILLIILLVASNIAWLIVWNSYDYSSEVAAANRQMANMNSIFGVQNAINAGFNATQAQLAQCCCDNRLATCQTQNIIQSESAATRFADANNTRDIIQSQSNGTQAILDKLCQLELDAKNDTISQLRSELLYAKGQASQDVQTAVLRQGQEAEVDALYNRLNNCPIGTVPVYGRQPIFNCGQNAGCGCGCAG